MSDEAMDAICADRDHLVARSDVGDAPREIERVAIRYGVSDGDGEMLWTFGIHERSDAIQRATDVGGTVHIQEVLYTSWKALTI